MLLEYDKSSEEIWCNIPSSESKRAKLEKVCAGISEKLGMPGLFGIVNHYDVLGYPGIVFRGAELASGIRPTHCVCDIFMSLPVLRRRTKDSELTEYVAMFVKELEAAYKSAWMLDVKWRSDSVYIKAGFNDYAPIDPRLLDPSKPLPGNDIKFMCDCGQYKSMRSFVSKCGFALDSNGKIGRGFYYNDSGRGCRDYVSLGNGKFFRNMGYVDRGYVSNQHSGYSYYARARNIDEKKIKMIPRSGCSEEEIYEPAHAFSSIEEFALFREASGGLKIGDSCYLYCVVIAPDGERRSESDTVCWDGAKWVDFYRETEVKNWPKLRPGWKLA